MSATHFVVRKSALDKRWDAFYSEPEIVALERRVQQKATHTLRDFARFMSGGATPLKSEGDQHYTDAANGVPFIRVQNLTTTGELDLRDVKHITHSTNNSSLARSRLSGGELLVKITGVGRMAVASVVPDGLEANINQHIAAITTDSKVQSEALAAYLNLDFVERLASRRATGGTRPALDYNALLSIPVIDDPRIVSIMQVAYAEKKQLEARASALLTSIDDYLLAELGITLPTEPENTIEKRIFTVRRRELTGGRFDPDMAIYAQHTRTSKYRLSRLRDHLLAPPQYGANSRGIERLSTKVPRYVRITDVNDFGELSEGLGVAAEEFDEKYLLQDGDLLFARSGNTVGKTYLHADTGTAEQHIFAGYMIRFKFNPATLLPAFAFSYTLCRAYKEWCSATQRAAGQPNINAEEYKYLLIPTPPIEKQQKIAAHVFEVRQHANKLHHQAEIRLKSAKQSVEKLILGEA